MAANIISLALVTAVLVRDLNFDRLIVYSVATAVFLILVVEEINPMWGVSEYFDLYDIFASGIGSICVIVTFELLKLSRKKRRYLDRD